MHKINQPGALASDRAGEFVLAERFPLPRQPRTCNATAFQPTRIVSWRVNRWLGVDAR